MAKRSRLHRFAKFVDRLPVFTILSSLAALLVIVAAAGSSWRSCMVGVHDWRGRLHAVGSDRRGLVFFSSDMPFGLEERLTADAAIVPEQQGTMLRNRIFVQPYLRGDSLGFWYAHGAFNLTYSLPSWFGSRLSGLRPLMSCKFGALLVPYWASIPLLLVLPGAAAGRWNRRRSRRQRGLCGGCGYDLRQSPGRCPECGAEGGKAVEQDGSPRWRAPWLAATLVVLVLTAMRFRHGSPVHVGGNSRAIPQRTIANLELKRAPLKAAIEEVGRAANVKIDVAWDAYPPEVARRDVSVCFKSLPLKSALEALAAFLPQPEVRGVGEDRVEIGREDATVFVHAYAVGDLLREMGSDYTLHYPLGQSSPTSQPSYRLYDSLGEMVGGVMAPKKPWLRDTGMMVVAGRLILVGTDRQDQAVRETLRILRGHGSPLGEDHEAVAGYSPDEANERLDARTGISPLDGANVVVDWESQEGKKFWTKVTTDGGVTVYGAWELPGRLVGRVRVYDIDDLIRADARFRKIPLSGRSQWAIAHPAMVNLLTYSRAPATVVRAVPGLINTDQWMDNGDIGNLGVLGTKMIVRTTTENHRLIEQLLARMRGAREPDLPEYSMGRPTKWRSVIRTYDVRDIVYSIVEYRRRFPEAQPVFVPSTQEEAPEAEVSVAVYELLRLIYAKVEADSWRANGGSIGAATEVAGLLVVSQTKSTHEKLARLLEELRDPGKLKEFLPAN